MQKPKLENCSQELHYLVHANPCHRPNPEHPFSEQGLSESAAADRQDVQIKGVFPNEIAKLIIKTP